MGRLFSLVVLPLLFSCSPPAIIKDDAYGEFVKANQDPNQIGQQQLATECASNQYLSDTGCKELSVNITKDSCNSKGLPFIKASANSDNSCGSKCEAAKYAKDAECITKKTTCQAGEKLVEHSYKDNECSKCGSGEYLDANICKPWSICSPGTHLETTAPSATQNRVCSDLSTYDKSTCNKNKDLVWKYKSASTGICFAPSNFSSWEDKVHTHGTPCTLPSGVTAKDDHSYEYDYKVTAAASSTTINWVCRFKKICNTKEELYDKGPECSQKDNMMRSFALGQLAGKDYAQSNFEDSDDKSKGRIFAPHGYGDNKVVVGKSGSTDSYSSSELRFILKGYQSVSEGSKLANKGKVVPNYNAGGFNYPLQNDLIYSGGPIKANSLYRYSLWYKGRRSLCDTGNAIISGNGSLHLGPVSGGLAGVGSSYFYADTIEDSSDWKLVVIYVQGKDSTIEGALTIDFTSGFLKDVGSLEVSKSIGMPQSFRFLIANDLGMSWGSEVPDPVTESAALETCATKNPLVENITVGDKKVQKYISKIYFSDPRIERVSYTVASGDAFELNDEKVLTSCNELQYDAKKASDAARECKPRTCKQDEYSNSGTCSKCPIGSFCDGYNKTKCLAGSYSPAGSRFCSSCPTGTYSEAGAGVCSSVEDFVSKYYYEGADKKADVWKTSDKKNAGSLILGCPQDEGCPSSMTFGCPSGATCDQNVLEDEQAKLDKDFFQSQLSSCLSDPNCSGFNFEAGNSCVKKYAGGTCPKLEYLNESWQAWVKPVKGGDVLCPLPSWTDSAWKYEACKYRDD